MTRRAPREDIDERELEVKEAPHSAVGPHAVAVAMSRAAEQMGVARTARTLLKLNQVDGFDCQGCGWPDPDPGHRHTAEFCENGAKAVAEEATKRRLGRRFFEQHSLADLEEHTGYWLGQQGRLTEPMVKRAGATHYEPITWDDAYRLIAEELRALGSPNEAVFYTSGRTSNEAAFLYQLMVRSFGTNNLPDCSNMCHESSGTALVETIGIGKGSVSLDDVHKAELVVVVGQNPGTNHPRMLSALEEAKRRGAKIIAVNPLEEVGLVRFKNPQKVRGMVGHGTPLADLHLPIRINGDLALFQAIAAKLLEWDALDHDFVERYTTGFPEYAASLRALDHESVHRATGLTDEQITEAARLFRDSKATIVCWAMGITQHRNSVATVKEITNVVLMQGNIGKPGAGLCPVRGHSNVQGDRTMGIWERPTDTFLDKLGSEFNFEPPRRHGYDTVKAIEAMHEEKARVFFALGGNFLSATPDTEYTADALRQCKLTVHVSTKLNRAHLITGEQALILPSLGRTETDVQTSGPQFVTTENSMGVVQSSRGFLPPASADLLSEPAIVTRLATATLGVRSNVAWQELAADYDLIRDHIERVVPGFDDYNARVRRPGGFHLPNAARDRIFKMQSGRAMFTVHALPQHDLKPDQYLMMTIRSHDQFNTSIYGLDDRYRGIFNV